MCHEFSGNATVPERFPPTFVVEEPLHLHGRPGVSDAEHGAGNDALLSRGTVRGPHQAPVGLVVEPLQDLHGLTSAHRQLTAAAITGDEVVDHHCQFTATGELQGEQEKSDVGSFFCFFLYKQKQEFFRIFQERHQNEQKGLCGAIFKKLLKTNQLHIKINDQLRSDNSHRGDGKKKKGIVAHLKIQAITALLVAHFYLKIKLILE